MATKVRDPQGLLVHELHTAMGMQQQQIISKELRLVGQTVTERIGRAPAGTGR
jgi:hypothetical protein